MNRKAFEEDIIKMILWIVVFLIALGSVVFLIKKYT